MKEISEAVSKIICQTVKNNRRSILGFSAGVTIKELYNQLSADVKKQKINFTDVITFNTDEYIDIDKRYKKYSKTNFMRDHLFSRINIKIENTNFPTLDN
jgi:glucosamine-6-phosphate deaminase